MRGDALAVSSDGQSVASIDSMVVTLIYASSIYCDYC
jgi:hypothetical protein